MIDTPGTYDRIAPPSDFRWPDGRNVAVVLNVAYETWGPGKRSGVGPMGNPLPDGAFDFNADSYGRYGANAGIHRLAGILDGAGVPGSFLTSGALAVDDLQQVRALADMGHELVAHGYTQDLIPSQLTATEDESSIQRTTDALANATGVRPQGWLSPRATAGPDTLRRLTRHGYTWHGDALDSDLPYMEKFPEGDLVAIPLSIELNDLPHVMRFGRTPRQYVELFDDALEHLLSASNDVVIVDVMAHAHCYGRAGNAWAYREVVERCAANDNIWLTTRGAIAQHFLDSVAR